MWVSVYAESNLLWFVCASSICIPYSCLGKNLKVKNQEKYGWEPRKLLSQLVDIYLHMNCNEFAAALAADEVRIEVH